jgi:putative (di)nucleoside polyphosphate hydrolase
MGSTPGSFRRGVDDGESPEQAMYRELYEEIGLKQDDVTLATSRNWLKYRLPKRLVRWDSSPVCIGQKQKWFLLQLDPAESLQDPVWLSWSPGI